MITAHLKNDGLRTFGNLDPRQVAVRALPDEWYVVHLEKHLHDEAACAVVHVDRFVVPSSRKTARLSRSRSRSRFCRRLVSRLSQHAPPR